MGYEQQQGFYKYHAGLCSDGVEKTVYTSNGVLIGFMDGQKGEERNENFGGAEDTFNKVIVAT